MKYYTATNNDRIMQLTTVFRIPEDPMLKKQVKRKNTNAESSLICGTHNNMIITFGIIKGGQYR